MLVAALLLVASPCGPSWASKVVPVHPQHSVETVFQMAVDFFLSHRAVQIVVYACDDYGRHLASDTVHVLRADPDRVTE